MQDSESEGLPVGLCVYLKNDKRDYILSSVDPKRTYEFTCDGDIVKLQGRFAFIRTNQDGMHEALLLGGTLVSAGGITINADRSGYWGRIDSVDYSKCRIETTRELPTDGSLIGQIVYISRREYSHKSAYRIRSVVREGGRFVIQLDADTLILGKGFTSTDAEPGMHEVHNVIPLEKSTSCMSLDTGYFRGKLIQGENGGHSRIINVLAAGGKRTILVPDAYVFKKGESLTIYDIQDGDTFEIPALVHIMRSQTNLRINSNTPAKIDLGAENFSTSTGTFTFNL